MRNGGIFAFLSFFLLGNSCQAAAQALPSLATLPPFFGVLLSIALCPLLVPAVWKKFDNWILAVWALFSVGLCEMSLGISPTIRMLSNIMIKDYVPFILLIVTMYVVSGGIHIDIHRVGTTKINTILFIVGEILANLMGTTGTSMLLLRPLLEINKHRHYKAHTVIFFIFFVSNIGGCLLPFGDPPLFLGYLKGVQFFWTAKHIFPFFLLTSVLLLLFYIFLDKRFLAKERKILHDEAETLELQKGPAVEVTGSLNIFLMFVVVGFVAWTGTLPQKVVARIFGAPLFMSNLLQNGGLIGISLISLLFSPKICGHSLRKINRFSWEPLSEVARYFVAIFITIAPINAMLKGEHEFFQPVCHMLLHAEHAPFLYFWCVSPFSAFLDNAPTYLVFFKMAGGNAQYLMNEGARILMAISASSVFMGALTYIGNAPNFMVKSIATQYGVRMPSFFGYMAWSCSILLPILLLVSFIFLY